MNKSKEGPWKIVTKKNPTRETCPLEGCGRPVKQYKLPKTPIPFYICENSKCDFATWAIWSDSVERHKNVRELSKIDFNSFYRRVNEEKVNGIQREKKEYWAYVLKTYDNRRPYYYVGETSRDPRWRLLEHSIPEHSLNSVWEKFFKKDDKIIPRHSLCLLKKFGPFTSRLESLYAESILHMAYKNQHGDKYVFGNQTEKIVPWKNLTHKPSKELEEHLIMSEKRILGARLNELK